MLYAKGFDVSVPGQRGCSVDGTSFAAPQVANLAAQLANNSRLTTAQLVNRDRRAARPPVTAAPDAVP